jgi:hypothetical protein
VREITAALLSSGFSLKFGRFKRDCVSRDERNRLRLFLVGFIYLTLYLWKTGNHEETEGQSVVNRLGWNDS